MNGVFLVTDYYTVGKVVNTQGLKGEVRVISSSDFVEERYKKGNELVLFRDKKAPLSLVIESHRKHKNFDLLTFKDYKNINDVESFRDGILKVASENLQDLEDDEYYYHEIIGLEVFTDEGQLLGKVNEIISTGANDVWVVKGEAKKPYLIPFIEPVVHTVDLDENRAIIHVLEGLID